METWKYTRFMTDNKAWPAFEEPEKPSVRQ